jgi:hypothetical protein
MTAAALMVASRAMKLLGVLLDRSRRREAAGEEHTAFLAACVRSAPIADIYYIDAFTIGASDVRDDVPLLH